MIAGLAMAWTSVWRSPRRTLLTAGALANAVLGGLLFYGFTRHTYWGLSESFARGGNGHVQVADADWFDAPAPEAHRVPRATLGAVRDALAADPRIGPLLVATAVRRNVVGMLAANGRSGVFMGVGTDPDAEAALAPLARPVRGDALRPGDLGAVVLGEALAARLGVGPGDIVTALATTDAGLTNAVDLEVRGLSRLGAEELDRTLATLPLDTALTLADSDAVDLLVLALAETRDTDAVLVATRDVLARWPDLAAEPWSARAAYYVAVRALYDRIFGVFELLMAVVTVLSLSHAVAAVVAERRQEIALLRVVGLTRRQVAGIFVLEGAILAAMGCVGGVVGAHVVAAITERLGGLPMPPPPGFTVGYAAQFHLDTVGYLVVLPVTMLAAVLASAVPAWKASRGALSRGLMG